MAHIPGIRRAFHLPAGAASPAEDVDDELRFHIETCAEALVAAGMEPAAARAEALRRFGDVRRVAAECRALSERRERASRLTTLVDELRQDLRLTLRSLARTPLFAAAAALTLALGIGAASAMFSVVHRLVLEPLPFPNGDRMGHLWRSEPQGRMSVQPPREMVEAWMARSRSIEWLEPSGFGLAMLLDGEPTEVRTKSITPTLAPRLGVRPLAGRSFVADDTLPGARVALLGERLWRSRYGGSREVLGRTLRLDDGLRTIVGVMPSRLAAIGDESERVDLWLPVQRDTAGRFPPALVLLREGVSDSAALAELDAIARSVATEATGPGSAEWRTTIMRPGAQGERRTALWLLLGAVGLVLLIASANVASLLLARSAARAREWSLRAVLGARRGRLVRHALVESLLLALLGGALGIALARALLALVHALRPESLAQLDGARLEPIGIAVALGLALATGLLFGIAPALAAAGADAGAAMERTASGGARARRFTSARFALVAGQVALSAALLVGAGLLLRTVAHLRARDPGFDIDRVLTAQIVLPTSRYPTPEARRTYYDALMARLRALPGVTAASLGLGMPPNGGVMMGRLELEGGETPLGGQTMLVGAPVDTAFFRTLGIHLREGRAFGAGDDEIVLGASLARKLWPSGSAVGRRLRLHAEGDWLTVVGVADDIAAWGFGTPTGQLQAHARWTTAFDQASVALRTDGDPAALARSLRAAVADSDPLVAVREVETMASRMAGTIAAQRFQMALLGAFALLALLLSAVGLYGVIAYAVSQRTREIGVRIALGALPRRVGAMVVWQGMRAALLGLALGLAGALAGARLLEGLVHGVAPRDPATYAAAALLIVAVALVASYLPARRAASVDPVDALRAE